MMKTFKALSALLGYPSAELLAALPEIRAALREEALLSPQALRAVEALLDGMVGRDLYDLQEDYVHLFDRSRALSLNLFEHVHGESRERGQAMVDLARLYDRAGMTIAMKELPDYLPLFLEFLSVLPLEEARSLLSETFHVLATLHQRLATRGTAYAGLFVALEELSCAPDVQAAIAPADPPDDDLAALDREWEEAAVTFGPGDLGEGCSATRLRTQLRAAQRRPPLVA